MAEQLSLEGVEAPPVPRDRLFFALLPDPATAASLEALARGLRSQHGLSGRPLDAQRLHITLHHLGDHAGVPAGLVEAARGAAAGLEAPVFDVSFDHVESFSGAKRHRPLVLRGEHGLAALMSFQQALGTAMKKSGLGRWAEDRFTPHVTLLYDDLRIPRQAVEPVSWTVRELVLVHSLIGRHKHLYLARWPLRA